MSEAELLLRSIERSVTDAVAGQPRVALAYSGGLDSSLLVALAKRETEVRCYVACTPGSHDAKAAPAHAEADGAALEILELTEDDIRRLAALAASILGSKDPVRVGYTIPLLSVVQACREGTVLVGNLADELFAGYAKYDSVEDPTALMKIDLEKALSELGKLNDYTNCEHKRFAAPFASKEVIETAASMPLSRLIGPRGRKLILREVARDIGLNAHDRPKKAAQYSSGVAKAIERMAKREGLSLRVWIESLAG
ncbi:MAG: asparagine synthase C-terminal domain-containing protein [Thermoplasmata archaeon]|nr:asparagine synthase C-terminal domain-containing protein [Thermoplasmata archaeon]